MNMEWKEKKASCLKWCAVFLVFLCISGFFVYMSSDATSPRFPTTPVYQPHKPDQGIFTLMGRYWLEEGRLPYTGLFDHKGPVIFLLNGLGWMMTGNVLGIAVIQSLFLAGYAVMAYRMLRQRHGMFFAYCATLSSMVMLRNVYSGGNTLEEYGLMFQMTSLTGLYAWSEQESVDHAPRAAFIYGLCAAFFVLNRAVDALSLIVGCAVIMVCLAFKGQWNCIAQNILAGLAGLGIPLAAFSAYFAYHGILSDFWYGMIGFNLKYMDPPGRLWFLDMGPAQIWEEMVYCVPIWMLLLCGVLMLLQGKYKKAGLWLAVGTSAVCYLFNSRFFDHYIIVYVPFAVIAAAELDFKVPSRKKLCLSVLAGAAMVYMLVVSFDLALLMEKSIRRTYSPTHFVEEKAYDRLVAQIPLEDRDEVVFYNCMASIYLKHDIEPMYRFFAFQDNQCIVSQEHMERICGEFASCRAKWVMTYGSVRAENRQVLEEHYLKVDESEGYALYCRNDVAK